MSLATPRLGAIKRLFEIPKLGDDATEPIKNGSAKVYAPTGHV